VEAEVEVEEVVDVAEEGVVADVGEEDETGGSKTKSINPLLTVFSILALLLKPPFTAPVPELESEEEEEEGAVSVSSPSSRFQTPFIHTWVFPNDINPLLRRSWNVFNSNSGAVSRRYGRKA
jgi:hypothetical protein